MIKAPKSLTDKSWMDRAQREKALDQVLEQSPKAGKWLRDLYDRQERLTTEGNAYGEVYSERQYGLATSPVFQREMLRAQVLKAAAERGLTLVELSELLSVPPVELMPHIVALRRRGRLVLEKVEDDITPVYVTVPVTEES